MSCFPEQASGSIVIPLSPLYYCEPEQGTVGTPDQETSGMSDQSLEQREVCSTEGIYFFLEKRHFRYK